MNNLHNYTNEQLADELGTLNAQIKELQAREKMIKETIKDRGIDKVQGDRFSITRYLSERKTLDRKAVIASLGEAWVLAHSKVTLADGIKVSALAH